MGHPSLWALLLEVGERGGGGKGGGEEGCNVDVCSPCVVAQCVLSSLVLSLYLACNMQQKWATYWPCHNAYRYNVSYTRICTQILQLPVQVSSVVMSCSL